MLHFSVILAKTTLEGHLELRFDSITNFVICLHRKSVSKMLLIVKLKEATFSNVTHCASFVTLLLMVALYIYDLLISIYCK